MSRKDRLDPRYLPLQKMLEKYNVTVEINKTYRGTTWPIAAIYPGRSNYVCVRAWESDNTKTVYAPDGVTTFEAPYAYLVSLAAVQFVLAELAASAINGRVFPARSRLQHLMKRFGLIKEKPKNGVLTKRVTAD